MQMSVVDVCTYLYPGEFEKGNISFGQIPGELPYITRWEVPGVEQPTIEYIISQMPRFQNQFDIDYFDVIGSLLIKDYMDEIVHAKQYDSAVSCASYTTSTIELWKRQADIFIAWRDSVFLYIIEQVQKMRDGERDVPTFDDFKRELPEITWN